MSLTSNSKLGEFKEIQTSFIGGMNRSVDPSQIGANEYTLLINGRVRYNTITPIQLPLQLVEGLPASGNMQGNYTAGSISLVFVDGLAYYRDFDSSISSYRQIAKFQMSPTVETIWIELVPASTLNFKRVAVNNLATSDINITSIGKGNPQCVVVQDGINQPWLIFPDGTSQLAQTYDQWNLDGNREYVPIGKMMVYIDGILHIVSPDSKRIYNSVTGRPLDFIIMINQDGDKVSDNENTGGALFLNHTVDYALITAMTRIDTPIPSGFLVTTNRSSYIVAPTTDVTLFGEPTYTNTYLFSTGALNQFCVNDILGDTTLIDFAGIRSFNAVTQYRIEGKNSPFYAKIFRIFEGIVQDIVASWTFDNYGLYAVNTVYGYGIVVYDTLLQSWVGLDLYGLAPIKQFSEIKTRGNRILLFSTADGKLYQAYVGQTARVQLFTKEVSSNDAEIELSLETLRLIYLDVQEVGSVKVTPYINRKQFLSQTKKISANYPATQTSNIPFGSSNVDTTENLTFNFQNLMKGFKTGFLIEWDFMSDLCLAELIGSGSKSQVSRKQQGRVYDQACQDV